ncbi:hypothetical protein EVAR_39114_1 [Eumeta japonica]|uniref:Uncharacterized protein n=1 Tax=Eumeta variegata TaxID=151549 RepID=A0A4C1X845_EUMVA|nr:hypothetical protein EVAR_39114_1 [Eumeta japonica]
MDSKWSTASRIRRGAARALGLAATRHALSPTLFVRVNEFFLHARIALKRIHVASDERWTLQARRRRGPNRKRRKARPTKRWSDDIITTAGKEWIERAEDRENRIKLEEAYTQIGVPIQENTPH